MINLAVFVAYVAVGRSFGVYVCAERDSVSVGICHNGRAEVCAVDFDIPQLQSIQGFNMGMIVVVVFAAGNNGGRRVYCINKSFY